jgi:putative ABC transport system ATP-binding protein
VQTLAIHTTDLEKTVQLHQERICILQDIQLQIPVGESVAITGASGSGKSTLLGLLAGLDLPSRGRIELMGHALTTLGEDERAAVRARHVGFVFQSFQLLPGLSALENALLPLEVLGQPDAAERAREMLHRVGLAHRLHHYPNQLSGGEQQRVALARAFVTEPDVLFADEPTGNLDTRTGATIIDQLFNLNAQQRTTLILVTHDLKLAAHCQRTLQLEEGRILTAEADTTC